jgi:hemerythrin-like domain-containing protein
MPTSADSAHQHMNTVIHDGLRRDLARSAQVLRSPMSYEQRAAFCAHLIWMLDQLHHHHVGEDDGVWPRVLGRRPDLRPLMEEMESEHHELSQASDALRAAITQFAQDGSDTKREGVATVIAQMRDATLPHLEHEEKAAMPLVLDALNDADWAYLEKNYFRKGMSLADAGRMFMWLLDDLDADRARVVKAELPAPAFWLVSRIYGPRYDVAAKTRWGDLAGVRA